MKKLAITFKLIMLVMFLSCSSGSDDDDNEIMNPPPNDDVSYTGAVKAIIDNNCIGCHGNPPTNNAPMSLTTSSNVKDAIESRNLITRIENGTMPPAGNLTTAQIQAIKDWQLGGFLE